VKGLACAGVVVPCESPKVSRHLGDSLDRPDLTQRLATLHGVKQIPAGLRSQLNAGDTLNSSASRNAVPGVMPRLPPRRFGLRQLERLEELLEQHDRDVWAVDASVASFVVVLAAHVVRMAVVAPERDPPLTPRAAARARL
jgi:hypothetical protein